MALELIGTFPVSGVNIGLAASVGGLNAQVTKLTADVSRLDAALISQGKLTASFPPNIPTFSAAFAMAANPATYAVEVAGMPGASFELNADLVVDLGIIDAQLAIITPLVANLESGLSVDGLAGWSYSGSAPGFGGQLKLATADGFGVIGPDAPVSAVIIATESFATWGSMSQSFHVGDSATAPADASNDRLRYLGMLKGGQWNTGCIRLKERINLFLGELRGEKSQVENSLQACLGLDLPEANLVLGRVADVVAEVGIDGLLDSLVTANADISGSITGLNAYIDATASLIAELNAQLSAGGLVVWRYSGTARGLGEALEVATRNGIPGGTGPSAAAYGIAIASIPANMQTFGAVFIM